MAKPKIDSPYKGMGAMTREQFLFFEMRTTAGLMRQGLSDEEIIARVKDENLFQYPTERSLERAAKCCIKRLKKLNSDTLLNALCDSSVGTAKQITLFAMMKNYRLVWDFMIQVIGEKFRTNDLSFSRADVNIFFLHLQEEDETVAEWSDTTVAKLKQVIIKILVENSYLENIHATQLKPVLINGTLESVIRASENTQALVAFNCF